MGRLSQLHDMEEHMHTINHGPDNVLDITLNGEVTTEDYDSLVPRLEDEIETHDEIRVLWDMSEMDGIEAGAVWEDLKLDLNHRADYGRVAVVGDERWHDWATQLFKPFAKGAVRYFDVSQRHVALEWAGS